MGGKWIPPPLHWGETMMEGASIVCETITMEGIRLLPPATTRTFSFFIHLMPLDGNNNKTDGLMVWLGGTCMLGYSVKYSIVLSIVIYEI
jgi:hypothetical protein